MAAERGFACGLTGDVKKENGLRGVGLAVAQGELATWSFIG